jgi:hypothetical protein
VRNTLLSGRQLDTLGLTTVHSISRSFTFLDISLCGLRGITQGYQLNNIETANMMVGKCIGSFIRTVVWLTMFQSRQWFTDACRAGGT